MDWLSDAGETGRLIAGRDWRHTSLGPLADWPQSLRTALGMVLLSPVPIVMLWGEDGVMLYNDAYSVFAGGRHPELLGSKVLEGWPEVADFNDHVMKIGLAGGTLAYRDQELTLVRHGRPEQVWMNLDYSPVLDEAGRPAGVIAIVIETTERVMADRRAATERERLFQAFEQVPGFIISMRGAAHEVEFVNAAHRRAFGSDDWTGKPIRAVYPDGEGQGMFVMLDKVFATGERVEVTAAPLSYRRPDGVDEQRFLTFVCDAMHNADGRIVGVLCEGADVTEQHLAQEAVRRSDTRLRTALEIETVGTLQFDVDGVLIDANEAFLQMSGYDRADLASGALSWRSLTPPEWTRQSEQAFADLKTRGETIPYEKEYIRKDGTRWWSLSAAKLLPDGTGFEFVLDVTDRKRAELALREQGRILETLNRTGAAISGELELESLIQLITDAAVELIGAQFGAYFHNMMDETGEQLHLFTLSGADREHFVKLGRPRATAVFGPTFRNEGVVRSGDILADPRYGLSDPHRGMPVGHLPVRSYLAVPVVSRSGMVLGGLLFGHPQTDRFDETHERLMVGLAAQAAIAIDNARLFQELQAARDTLEQRVEQRTAELSDAHEALRQAQKMEAVGQLTGGIAHDFNNLLTGISGSLEIIERRIAQGRTDGIARFLEGARTSAQRAAALTQRLLAFSRRQTLDPKPIDVNRLVAGMEELIRRTVGPAITVEVIGAGGLWPAKVDAAQLESALLNLAINARDAMPEGGRLTIETANKWLDERWARARDLPPGQYLSICATDTGTGMTKEIVDRIFDPFFTTKPIGQGTGLGLSMIHGFIRQSGGQVRVYTELGHGTTMCLYLPRHVGELAGDAEELVRPVREGGAGRTVLVIDDEPTVRMLIVELLDEAGYTVVEAEDGPSGLRKLDALGTVDLLITDVGLPGGMNGRQVADAARIGRPDLNILFVTGFAENAAVGNGHLDHGMAVVTKPFVMADLSHRIAEMLDR